MNSGQGALADAPAGVAGQHIHPSHVPEQNVPVNSIEKKKRFQSNCNVIKQMNCG